LFGAVGFDGPDSKPGIKYLLNNQSGDWKNDKTSDRVTDKPLPEPRLKDARLG
jgi:hypothetical protein